jgi:PAS domain S-box-containing protein
LTDLTARLRQEPELVRLFGALVRITQCNQAAFALMGCDTVEKANRIRLDRGAEAFASFKEELLVIWERRQGFRTERAYVRPDGRRIDTLLHWSAPMTPAGPDYRRVNAAFTLLTEVRVAEAALRESEDRYRQLFDANPNPMYVYERATLRFVAVNRAAIERYGYSAEEFAARTILDIRPPDEREKLRSIVAKHTGEPVPAFAGQWHHMKKDGGLMTVEVYTRDIALGGKACVLVLPIDLTEKIERERLLRISEERYRLLFEQSPLAIVEFDYTGLKPWFDELRAAGVTDLGDHLAAHPQLREEVLRRAPVADLNEPTVQLLGARSKQELIGRVREVFTESAIRVRCENAARIWRGLTTNQGELEVRRLDGEIRQLEFYWRMQTEDGRPTFRRTQTVLVDITDHKRAELALRESEARYREVFENAIDGIYRSSPDGHFIAANPALARMLGFASPAELIEHDVRGGGAPLYVKPGRREEFRALHKGGQFVTNFESEVRRKDGERIWISENVRAVLDAGNRVRYYEGFVSDITPRRRLEAEMLRASKLEAVGILAGGIAHDFNNILTVVLGNITLAEQDTEAQASVAALLRDAKRATLRARDLTQQLLTFAKGGDPVRTAIELPELLRESVEFALHGAKARAEYQVAPDLWPVNADKGQIGQVVQNLVINAVQAMPQGLVVVVRAENRQLPGHSNPPLPAGRFVKLSVEDTGVGIPAEHLGKIFDPYFTTKQSGSGLGLATVYSIVKKHQGHIEVESQLGVGTKFHIWLPAAEAREPAPSVRRLDGDIVGARILFMDDEAGIRAMAALFIQRLGAEVSLAEDGAQAVEKFLLARASGRPFDAVIMDLTVPGGMGGREATQRLLDLDPGVKVIVSSGYSRDPVMANHKAHGFKGILPKPYGPDQMRTVLHSVLQGRNSATPFS